MKFIDELKRRNVIKATIAYIVVAWVLLQVIAIVLPNFGAPEWVFKTLTFVITIGLPIWIIFSWIYEVTPEGIKKTSKVSEEQSITATTNKRLNITIIITLIIAIGVSFINKPKTNSSLRSITNKLTIENSIAVLPFVNMSDDIEQEYFADGLSEELINMLTRLPSLKVIGRTSSFAYKGKNEDLREIGRSLDVTYLLEGSVRKSGNKIRITAQLINTIDGSHRWSKTFDRSLDNIFEIQDEISSSVVNALSITLSKDQLISKSETKNSVAYNFFLRGKYYYEIDSGKSDTDEAIKWFNEAINSDPSFSLAWTYKSMCYWRKSTSSDDDWFKEAKIGAFKAFELDPTSGIAAVNVAEILDNEYDFYGALNKIDLAIKLEPNNPYVLRNAGRFYTILGRKDESIAFCKSALKNDPIQRTALNYLIAAFYYAKQYDNVKMKIEEFIDKYPQLIRNIIPINVLALESDLGPSIEDAIKANYKLTELYAKVLQSEKMKNKQAERELISQMIKNYSDNPYMIALSFAGIGNKIKAMDWLEKSYYTKDKELVYVNVEPIFKELRTMDRFNNLIKKMNFPK
jgi:adenylate cyclase